MKGLLRSVIDFGGVTQDNLIANFQKLIASQIEWTHPSDERVFTFLRDYFHQRLEMPSKQTVVDYFENRDDQESIERIGYLDAVSHYSRTNYTHRLHNIIEEQNKIRALTVLKEAQEIISKGMIIDEEKKQGLKDGVLHFTRNVHRLLVYQHTSRVDGNIREDGDEVWNEYLDAKANKHLVWGKFCGLNNIDTKVRGIKKGEMWVHAAFTGELKCLAGDTTVFDHRTQRRRRLKELFDCHSLPIVSAIEHEGQSTRIVLAPASHLVENGEREVFDLILSSGRTIGATSNHKFLTPDGWVELGNLKEGDFIATPKILRADGLASYTEAEVKLVGYLIGDGHLKDCITFTQENVVIRNDFISCLTSLGLIEGDADYENPCYSTKFPEDRTPYVSVSHGLGDRWHRVTSPVRVLLERLDLYGKDSYDKRIPSEFFGLPENLIAILLGALWSTDGSCSTGDYVRADREGKKGGLQSSYVISYASVNQGLCIDIQSLLLRLGIQSTVTFVDTKVNDDPYRFWVVRVVTNPSKALFCKLVVVVGKGDAFSFVASRLPTRDSTLIPSALLPDGERIRVNGYWRYTSNHKGSGRDVVTSEVALKFGVDTGDIYWDRVKSVSLRGVEMTYDLSVPGHHTFVANDIITHNTSFALNWAYNLVTRYRSNIVYVTLEMPYEQVLLMIHAMHTSNGKYTDVRSKDYNSCAPLDYEKICAGTLTPDEKAFYQEVINDFATNVEYGRFDLWGPDDDVTSDDIQMFTELRNQENPVHLLIIDHGSLMEPRKKRRNKDYTVELNSVLRDTKKMALHFNHGEKVPILLLFQINRDGKDFADKNEGRYKLRALSYANEAERSADVITTTYLNDEHRKNGTTMFDCLKRRDGIPFQPFMARIHWGTRRIGDCDQFKGSNDRGMSIDDLRAGQNMADNMFLNI